jgi:hypothetical protein
MPDCISYGHGVQLKKLNSAALVAAKLKAMIAHMKKVAEEAVNTHGVKGATAGNLTPLKRFTEDTDVPTSTRYAIPLELINATYGASQQEATDMDAWDQDWARENAALKKEDGAGPSTSEPANVDLGNSQQTTLSMADGTTDLHTSLD